jgi:hypothetical protein
MKPATFAVGAGGRRPQELQTRGAKDVTRREVGADGKEEILKQWELMGGCRQQLMGIETEPKCENEGDGKNFGV